MGAGAGKRTASDWTDFEPGYRSDFRNTHGNGAVPLHGHCHRRDAYNSHVVATKNNYYALSWELLTSAGESRKHNCDRVHFISRRS